MEATYQNCPRSPPALVLSPRHSRNPNRQTTTDYRTMPRNLLVTINFTREGRTVVDALAPRRATTPQCPWVHLEMLGTEWLAIDPKGQTILGASFFQHSKRNLLLQFRAGFCSAEKHCCTWDVCLAGHLERGNTVAHLPDCVCKSREDGNREVPTTLCSHFS